MVWQNGKSGGNGLAEWEQWCISLAEWEQWCISLAEWEEQGISLAEWGQWCISLAEWEKCEAVSSKFAGVKSSNR